MRIVFVVGEATDKCMNESTANTKQISSIAVMWGKRWISKQYRKPMGACSDQHVPFVEVLHFCRNKRDSRQLQATGVQNVDTSYEWEDFPVFLATSRTVTVICNRLKWYPRHRLILHSFLRYEYRIMSSTGGIALPKELGIKICSFRLVAELCIIHGYNLVDNFTDRPETKYICMISESICSQLNSLVHLKCNRLISGFG